VKAPKETNKLNSIERKKNFIRSRLSIVVVSLLVLVCIASTILFWPMTNSAGLLNLAYQQIVINTSAKATTTLPPREILTPAAGPLRVDPANPRYFTDGSGKAIFLTGSNYWNLLQDGGRTNPPPAFDYDAFINFAVGHGYNYLKWHTWEHAWHQSYDQDWYIQPTIYARTGPGNALDGSPKFNLDLFNPDFFDRLRSRVLKAEQSGLYVVVDIFQRFSIRNGNTMSDQWLGHPFNVNNNINGINGDPTDQGNGLDTETLIIPAITTYQEAYVRKMIDTLNDLDNVIWEVAMEPDGTYSRNGYNAFGWLNHFLNYVHTYEATKSKQHPVLYSVFYPGGSNNALFTSNAEMVAPNGDGGFYHDSPTLNGTKVVLIDTDHIDWTSTDDSDWAWKAFTRGAGGFALMDGGYSNYDDQGGGANYSDAENTRYNMGWILDYANRMNLVAMTPRDDLCSTGYCLANPVENGAEYLVYLPAGSTTTTLLKDLGMRSQDHKRISSTYLLTDSSVTVDLTSTPGTLTLEWFNPSNGEVTSGGTITGGAGRNFTAPFTGSAVLYLHSTNNPPTPTSTVTPKFRLFLLGILK
jgi:hypothetical protein